MSEANETHIKAKGPTAKPKGPLLVNSVPLRAVIVKPKPIKPRRHADRHWDPVTGRKKPDA